MVTDLVTSPPARRVRDLTAFFEAAGSPQATPPRARLSPKAVPHLHFSLGSANRLEIVARSHRRRTQQSDPQSDPQSDRRADNTGSDGQSDDEESDRRSDNRSDDGSDDGDSPSPCSSERDENIPLTPSMLSAAHPELRRRVGEVVSLDEDYRAPAPRKSILKRDSVSERTASTLRFRDEADSVESNGRPKGTGRRRVSISESESLIIIEPPRRQATTESEGAAPSIQSEDGDEEDLLPDAQQARGQMDAFTSRYYARRPLFRSLAAQQPSCPGCNAPLTRPPTLVERVSDSFKQLVMQPIRPPVVPPLPRRCHFSGLLFCSECHVEDLRPIPSLVLAAWDFQPRPVCRVAAACLDAHVCAPVLSIKQIHPAIKRMVGAIAKVHSARRELILLKTLHSEKRRRESLWWREETPSYCDLVSQKCMRKLLPCLPGSYWLRCRDSYSFADLELIDRHYRRTRVSLLSRSLRVTPSFLGPLLGCTVEPDTARRPEPIPQVNVIRTPSNSRPLPPPPAAVTMRRPGNLRSSRTESFTMSYSHDVGWTEGRHRLLGDFSDNTSAREATDPPTGSPTASPTASPTEKGRSGGEADGEDDHNTGSEHSSEKRGCFELCVVLEEVVAEWEVHVLQCRECSQAFEELRPDFRNMFTVHQKTF